MLIGKATPIDGLTGPVMPKPTAAEWLKRLTNFREFMILAIILAGCLAMTFASPTFMTVGNWSALLLQVSVECIVAIGMTILLISGGFDLSVGSTFAIAGAVTAKCLVAGVPVAFSILTGLGIGVGSLTLLGVDVYWNTLVVGGTLLVSVLIDNLGRRRRKLD